MAATSINIQPVKAGSESHNLREKELDYVNKELTPLNKSISHDTIANRLEIIKAKYTATTGQQMQKKATPIREGVIVIAKSTDMWHLERLAKAYERRFGLRAIQIHMHIDEGHTDLITQEWKPNLHAHMVFDWTDKETGKSIKLNRQDMAEMQTMCAEYLYMERGVSSDVKHLNAIQFKTKKAAEEFEKVSLLVENKATDLEYLKVETEKIKPKENVSKAISKTAEIALELLGKSKNDKEKDALKTENVAWEEKYKTLEEKFDYTKNRLSVVESQLSEVMRQNKRLTLDFEAAKEKYKSLVKDIVKLADILPQNIIDSLRRTLPSLYKAGAYAQQHHELERRNRNAQPGFEM